MENVIDVNNLRKVYPLYEKKSDKVREAFSFSGKKFHKDFEALKGISFSVAKGECVGIIGLNGSGKSTLLKILSGVIRQSSGEALVRGKTAALLELGAGFNPEYSGMENIYLNTLLMGFTREETDAALPEILAFADIGDFIYQPVKIYSSGMFVRLAFAIAVSVNPDILLIDEALSVGDVFFQQKCYAKIREFREKSTVLIVSHDLNAITRFCPRVLLMNRGELLFDGNALDGVAQYYKVRQGDMGFAPSEEEEKAASLSDADLGGLPFRAPDPDKYSGKGDMSIDSFYYDVDGDPFAGYIEKGCQVTVHLLVSSHIQADNLIVGYQVLDRYGNEVFGETSLTCHMTDRTIDTGKSRISLRFTWPEVREGDYFITLGLGVGYEVLRQVEECWINQAIHFVNTTHGKVIYGLFNNPMDDFCIAGLPT